MVAGYDMAGSPKPLQDVVEERLGHKNDVCANCNAKLRRGREKCLKCGKKEPRRNARHPSVEFRDS